MVEACFRGIHLGRFSKITYGVLREEPATYEAESIYETTTNPSEVLFVFVRVLVMGVNFHDSVVGQEAVPVSRVPMLPDEI